MNYIILIIAGIAGLVAGTYLGKRCKTGKSLDIARDGSSDETQGKSLDENQGKEREAEKNKRENLEKARSLFAGRYRVANN
ncbi:MAG: hypothetical protein Q8L57_03455, partial [bacterium]|nr:hypothetical protein [bacterium]